MAQCQGAGGGGEENIPPGGGGGGGIGQDKDRGKRWTTEEKEVVIKMVMKENMTCADAAEKSGVSVASVSRWVRDKKAEILADKKMRKFNKAMRKIDPELKALPKKKRRTE